MARQQTTGQDIQRREFVVSVETEALEGHRKKGVFLEPDYIREFTVYCDEGPRLGANTAPPPIGYFLQSAAFCTLTQLTRYGEMMKIGVNHAKVSVRARFRTTGSVLQETIEASTLDFEVKIEVDSDAPPERVAALIRNAEAGCYVMQAIRNPITVTTTVDLNGEALVVEG